MRNVKLKPGNCAIIPLEKKLFEDKTGCNPPHYPAKDTNYPFAVCPQCDNPVKILGFYNDIKPSPYAEHFDEDVVDLASFVAEDKEFCPYYDTRRTISKTARKTGNPSFVNEIKSLLNEQYDRIIYLLENALNIYISNKLAEEMMHSYVASRAWLYSWTTINNLPWTFGYMQVGKSLMGRLIVEKSPLYKAISKKCKDAQFEPVGKKGYAKLVSCGKFINLSFCLMHHERKMSNGLVNETVKFVVSHNDEKIYSEVIKIDETHFINLINQKANENLRYRKDELLVIAGKYVKSCGER